MDSIEMESKFEIHAQNEIRSMYRSHHKGKWNEHENQYISYT